MRSYVSVLQKNVNAESQSTDKDRGYIQSSTETVKEKGGRDETLTDCEDKAQHASNFNYYTYPSLKSLTCFSIVIQNKTNK